MMGMPGPRKSYDSADGEGGEPDPEGGLQAEGKAAASGAGALEGSAAEQGRCREGR